METTPLVVLIGPPAAGKTRVGKALAHRLGIPFLDTDAIVSASHGPIPEIFRTRGEPHFRELEREAVREALSSEAVVSLGGGAVTDPDTRSDLLDRRVALLTISEDAVVHRLNPEKRPLLAGGIESWRELVERRMPVYRDVADATFDTSHQSADEVAVRIEEWLTQELNT